LGSACNEEVKKDLPKEQGLPTGSKNFGNCSVSRFMQDKSGNLWFGTTDNGLYKYDGKSFNQFTTNDGLDCNKIYCILEDKDGKIWVGTEVGLCLYNGMTFSKIQIPLPKNLPPNKNPVYQTHWV
jgi:ligand-binding sensor domain-containing protein